MTDCKDGTISSSSGLAEIGCWPVLTDRLSRRRFRAADFEGDAAYHRRADVYRYLYAAIPDDEALAKQFSALMSAPFKADGDTLRLSVSRRHDDELLGEVLLKIASKAALQGEVGYIFNPALPAGATPLSPSPPYSNWASGCRPRTSTP